MKLLDLRLDRIRLDARTQSRACTRQELVEDYTELVLAKVQFPAIIVFFDGASYWPGDGWHRIYAHVGAKRKTILAEIRPGSERDAVLHSCGANKLHGAQPTREDKRHAVGILLADPEWAAWSNNRIAEQCGVSKGLVALLRSDLSASIHNGKIHLVQRGGKTYEMNTEAIGHTGEPVAAICPTCGSRLAG